MCMPDPRLRHAARPARVLLHDLFAAADGRSILFITHRSEALEPVDEFAGLGRCCS